MMMVYSDRIQGANDAPPQPVRSLSTALKTLQLLDYLGTLDRPVRLSEAAADLSGNRSTIYQRLVTLIEAGWVEQTDDSRFQLTMRAVQVAGAALEQASLGERTLPVLRRLVAECRETASLAVIQNLEPIIVQRVEAGGVLQARAQLGTSMELPTSASGRVLIAFASADELAALRAAGAEFPDDDTLAEVRRTGVGTAAGLLGVGAVAAPVFDHRQRCIAALSLVGPATRFDVAGLSQPVLDGAKELSILLGGRPWSRGAAMADINDAESRTWKP